MAFRLDRSTIAPPQRRADGSVVYEGPVTRTGVFKYVQADGSVRAEYRPPAEVGHQDSLASLELCHVCDDHPVERGQAKGKAVGAVGPGRFDGRLVIAKVMVRDDAANAKVANGKAQLSCGYDTVLVETPGTTPEGERYDAIQTQIRYEHVAIVAAGRAGPEVRLRLDALEPEDVTDPARGDAAINPRQDTAAMITPEQHAAALAQIATEKTRADAAEAKAKTADAALAAEKTRADTLAAERDAANDKVAAAEKARKDAVDQGPVIARARVELEHKVKPILGADFKFDADGKPLTDTAVRLAVLDKLGVKTDAADRASEFYVKARFDGALDTHAAAGANVDAARGAGTRSDAKPVMTEAEAMAEAKRKADARSKPPTATA